MRRHPTRNWHRAASREASGSHSSTSPAAVACARALGSRVRAWATVVSGMRASSAVHCVVESMALVALLDNEFAAIRDKALVVVLQAAAVLVVKL